MTHARLIERLRERAFRLRQQGQDFTAEVCTEAADALAQSEKDAARYRAMRNGETDPDMEQPYCTVHKTNSWGKWFNTYETGDELDAAIDAAILKEPPCK